MLEPGDRSRDFPAACVPPQEPAVLSLILGETPASVRGDHLATQSRDLVTQGLAVVGLVTDDPLGDPGRQHEVEHLL